MTESDGEIGKLRKGIGSVRVLLDRTCCQFDGAPRWTCRTALQHKRDWCLHCRVSAALDGGDA